MPPRPMAPRDDEENSQARELANYERRQQAQRQRTQGGWRGGNRGWVPGVGSGDERWRRRELLPARHAVVRAADR